MISRRLIRIKVLQTLYSAQSREERSLSILEKEYFHSINKTYELYLLFLQVPIELAKAEEQKIDIGLQKFRPTPEERNPNMRFCQNAVIERLRKNVELTNVINEKKVNWANNADFFKTLNIQLRQYDFFNDYMNKPSVTFEDDKKILLNIIDKIVPNTEAFDSILEDMSIFWNDEVEFVLNMVSKTIKSFEEGKLDKPLMKVFKNEDDQEFAKQLIRNTLNNQDEYNKLIRKYSQNWDMSRMAVIDHLIMQTAIAEIVEFPSIPVKVSLNEYIDLAKLYSTDNSNTFINGILDSVVKDLKSQGKVVKTGRGLIDN
ncbi:MAG TPA: transcription antitermination factor NusB [Bacteroidales bacterium]|nr:transcription antitermination factor NusB [Bacteroidales bacterium]